MRLVQCVWLGVCRCRVPWDLTGWQHLPSSATSNTATPPTLLVFSLNRSVEQMINVYKLLILYKCKMCNCIKCACRCMLQKQEDYNSWFRVDIVDFPWSNCYCHCNFGNRQQDFLHVHCTHLCWLAVCQSFLIIFTHASRPLVAST